MATAWVVAVLGAGVLGRSTGLRLLLTVIVGNSTLLGGADIVGEGGVGGTPAGEGAAGAPVAGL